MTSIANHHAPCEDTFIDPRQTSLLDEDYTDEEIELLEKFDDPAWRDVVREGCILHRLLRDPVIAPDVRHDLQAEIAAVRQDLKDIRAIHRKACKIRRGKTVHFY